MNETYIANLALAKIGATLITSIESPTVKESVHAKLHYGVARDQVLRDHAWKFANKLVVLKRAATPQSSDIYVSLGDGKYVRYSYNGLPTPWYQAQDGSYITIASVIDPSSGESVDRWTIVNELAVVVAQADTDCSHPMESLGWIDPIGFSKVDISFYYDGVGLWKTVLALPSDCLRPLVLINASGEKTDKFQRLLACGTQVLALDEIVPVTLSYTARITDVSQFDSLFIDALVTLLASKLARAISGSDSMESQLLQTYMTAILPEARFRDTQETDSAENRDGIGDFIAGDMMPRRYGRAHLTP